MAKRKHGKAYLFCFIGLVAFTAYFGFKISREIYISNIITEREMYCANLTFELAKLNKTCICHFEGFKTGNPEVDSATSPLCACECVVNGTPVKIGVLDAGGII